MRPNEYTNAGALLLVAGVLNLVIGMTLLVSLLIACIGVLWIVPTAVGLGEIVMGVSVLNGNRRPNAFLVGVVGALASIANCNVVSLVCEIVAIVLLLSPATTLWLEADGEDAPPPEF